LNRTANPSSIVRPAVYDSINRQKLAAAFQFPAYVWVGMVLLAAAAVCYSLREHTQAELNIAGAEHRIIVDQIKRLGIENTRLRRELDAVEKDPRTIEMLARQAGMVADGEAVVLVEQQPKPSQTFKPQSGLKD